MLPTDDRGESDEDDEFDADAAVAAAAAEIAGAEVSTARYRPVGRCLTRTGVSHCTRQPSVLASASKHHTCFCSDP